MADLRHVSEPQSPEFSERFANILAIQEAYKARIDQAPYDSREQRALFVDVMETAIRTLKQIEKSAELIKTSRPSHTGT